ncbi:MAG: hypothetical protein CMK59_00185 [Proteobacteria bacterium]|nr:hypothetical protein [Pseudomonadota bacterium]
MSLLTLSCKNCAGQITMVPGKSVPTCPFCDSEQMEETSLDSQVVQPEQLIDFEAEESVADKSFRTLASSSWWYPSEIRNAKLELKRIYIPAWSWSVDIESYYAGLKSASTKSGKKPFEGHHQHSFSQILTPASTGVSLNEINDIAPFDTQKAQPFQEAELQYPFEPALLSQDAATQLALKKSKSEHEAMLKSQLGALELKCSSIVHRLEGDPALLPIYIGVYKRNDIPYRIVVNGLTGKITGTIPYDKGKIIGVCVAVLLLIVICLGIL